MRDLRCVSTFNRVLISFAISAALNLAEAKTRQLVDVLAIDALAELRSYLDGCSGTEVAQLDILWEEKVERVREIDDLLSQQREAVRSIERSFKHLVEP